MKNFRISVVAMMILLSLSSCVTQKKVDRKLEKKVLKAKLNNMDEMLDKYKGWEPGGTKSVELSLLEHNSKRNSGSYQEYKGTAEEAITQSQAKSLAQANAYAMFAKDIGSIVQAAAKKHGEVHKTNEGTTAFENFRDEITQNAIIAANNFLEKSFVFVKKAKDGTWAAEVMYLFNQDKDLDAVNATLKKTLQNTKLTVKEKLWLKKLMDDLNK